MTAKLGRSAAGYRPPRVVTNLAVLDFETPDPSEPRRMRLRTVHPGVSVDEVVAATAFELVIADDIDESRSPTDDEQAALDAPRPEGSPPP